MNKTKTKEWYRMLRKPTWAPPSWIFGPVWTVLYVIIALTFGYVTLGYFKGTIPVEIFTFFVLNLIFNVLYSPLQFGLRNLLLATLDIYLVLATLIAALVLVYPYGHWIALANIPYLLWVSLATILQTTITLMNRKEWR